MRGPGVRIDLNADVGEGGDDGPLMPLVTSVNIACGAHAGDAATMSRAVEEAGRLGLAVGAHPGYADPEHFGRRELALPEAEVERTLAEQIRALAVIAERFGVRLSHVKPHGALYNQAAVDPVLARAVASAVGTADPGLRLVGLAGSALPAAGADAGLAVAGEAFADRRYRAGGTLAPRSLPGAVIEDPETAAAQALAIARGAEIETIDGHGIALRAETLCVHGDTPGALAVARAVRRALVGAGIEIAPL